MRFYSRASEACRLGRLVGCSTVSSIDDHSKTEWGRKFSDAQNFVICNFRKYNVISCRVAVTTKAEASMTLTVRGKFPGMPKMTLSLDGIALPTSRSAERKGAHVSTACAESSQVKPSGDVCASQLILISRLKFAIETPTPRCSRSGIKMTIWVGIANLVTLADCLRQAGCLATKFARKKLCRGSFRWDAI